VVDPPSYRREPAVPRLLPLILSGDFETGSDPGASGSAEAGTQPCAFCGMHSGRWQRSVRSPDDRQRAVAACPLCFLCLHLDRPTIDAEAALIWLPEMSQAALNVTQRAIHIELRALGQDLDDAGQRRSNTPGRAHFDHARAILGARGAAAVARLGTDRPSELAAAFYRLSPGAYANRAKLLAGVRLLPRGRFYDRGADVYPEIVDLWRGASKPQSSLPPGRPAPLAPG
jgi:intracellular multiplication protein IcmJ